MTLSLNKLTTLLEAKNIVIQKVYTIKDMCVYIQCMCLGSDSFMLYIPSKYDIICDNSDYKLDYLEIPLGGSISDDYADEPELQESYDEIETEIDPLGGNMEKQLEENYNRPVSLKDLSRRDMTELKEIFRQLKRLRYCIQNLKYKLCIQYDKYLCCIRRDDTFECFIISTNRGSHMITNNNRVLFVSIDLETLYGKLDNIHVDVKTIKEGIYTILDKNQIKNVKNLHKMLEHKLTFTQQSSSITVRKTECDRYLSQLEKMLKDLLVAEKNEVLAIQEVQDNYSQDSGVKGLHGDIERSHIISKHQTEIGRIHGLKEEIMKNIIKVRSQRENLSLRVDSICFDNTIMLDAILKNFISFSEV